MLILADDNYFYLNHKPLTSIGGSDANFVVIQKHVNTANSAYAAMANFCRRVQKGEVRSQTTYNEFIKILDEAGYVWNL